MKGQGILSGNSQAEKDGIGLLMRGKANRIVQLGGGTNQTTKEKTTTVIPGRMGSGVRKRNFTENESVKEICNARYGQKC